MPIRRTFQHKKKIRDSSATNQHDSTMLRRQQQRCLVWIKLALSASIPLLIAIFTIVSHIQTNHINEYNRQKDIEIANLTRLQEQKLADEQYQQDQQKADELHFQTVFANYIEEISSIIYKQNQSIFTSEDMKMSYIRAKTLLTLRSIDSTRKSQLFIFLHENNLLPTTIKSQSTVHLSGADLSNITVQSPVTIRYNFRELSLKLVNLMNARFINCDFIGQTDFSGSTLINTQFVGTSFSGGVNVFTVNLTNASFTDCAFRGEITFQDSTLSGVSFQGSNFYCGGDRPYRFSKDAMVFTNFRGALLCNIDFKRVNLSYADFRGALLENVAFIDTILSNATVDMTTRGISTIKNVRLPNGTWTTNISSNLIKNGDAEANCHSFNGIIDNWENYLGNGILYHHNETLMRNATGMNNCSFGSKHGLGFHIYQTVFFPDMQMFLESGEAEYKFSACFGGIKGQCKEGQVRVYFTGYTNIMFVSPHIPFSESQIQWQCQQIRSPVNYDNKKDEIVSVQFGSSSEYCILDNIQLFLKLRLDKY